MSTQALNSIEVYLVTGFSQVFPKIMSSLCSADILLYPCIPCRFMSILGDIQKHPLCLKVLSVQTSRTDSSITA